MAAYLGIIGSILSFAVLIFKEWSNRNSAAALQNQAYVLNQAEFQNIVDSVSTRLRLQAAKDSQAAQTTESQVDASLNERNNEP